MTDFSIVYGDINEKPLSIPKVSRYLECKEMDKNKFFREATLKICGNLQIHLALQQCLHYLQQYMPGEVFQLAVHDEGLSSLKTIALVTLKEAKRLNIVYSLDDESRRYLQEQEHKSSFRVESPAVCPLSKQTLRISKLNRNHCGMVMNLNVKGNRPGNLILLANGTNRFSKKDLELFSMMNEPFAVALANALNYDEVNRLKDAMADDIHYLREKLIMPHGQTVIGENFGLKQVMEMTRSVAPMNSPVLLGGETGVGKEVIANAVHQFSRRKNGPFIKVNCGAIPDSLIDSELFGHEKGAFTGAIEQKRGCFERASKGTIFLDEIAELPLPAQVRMLRVIQERKILRVGGSREIEVDIRIIAATHQDLELMVEQGVFRSDLWFRLNVFPITITPLRERTEDIPALVDHFIDKKSKELGFSNTPKLMPNAMISLKQYSWPGNARELENVVERTMILNQEGPLSFDEILWQNSHFLEKNKKTCRESFEPLDLMNKKHIIQALELTGGKIHGPNGAATLLGLNPSTLRFRIRKLGITR